MQTYEALRAMGGRGQPVMPLDLAPGDVIRVDRMKYRVEGPIVDQTAVTGSAHVPAYSEDNQCVMLYVSASAPVQRLGSLP